ncbi:hypothetical protein KO529_04710 [Arenibacter algicola]|uniref:hypothetical protein n=1 Tax=Arenibacter algicola TaxID=616991 RepID=UPI001C07ECAB|nr:hypothetical protein [Arenibacter algicola]MBU2904077.1 hypothetical protein [Arenibacter algicola]
MTDKIKRITHLTKQIVTLSLTFNLLFSCNSKKKEDLSTKISPSQKQFIEKSKINVPYEVLTQGPSYHWFGYYDKLQTDPSDRYVLSMKSDFENRSPGPEDVIKIGMIDLHNGNKWIELGTTRAWNWQQGCMLQWRPGSDEEVLWNDREDDRFVCHILNIKTMENRKLPVPIYTVSSDGMFGLSTSFERIQDLRAGYGYPGLPDSHKDVLAPEDIGIFRVSLEDGTKKLLVSMDEVVDIPYLLKDLKPFKHYFNHLDINEDGSRFVFLNRWVNPTEGARIAPLGTRMITASTDGGNLTVVNDSRMTSHFWWKNSNQILAYANRPENGDNFNSGNHFYLFDDVQASERQYNIIGQEIMTKDGHCSYLQNQDWILNDSYPNANREMELYLFNTTTEKKIVLGNFYLPVEYKGEWRVDMHPRQTRDGKKIIIDIVVGESGRQMVMLDISTLNVN